MFSGICLPAISIVLHDSFDRRQDNSLHDIITGRGGMDAVVAVVRIYSPVVAMDHGCVVVDKRYVVLAGISFYLFH